MAIPIMVLLNHHSIIWRLHPQPLKMKAVVCKSQTSKEEFGHHEEGNMRDLLVETANTEWFSSFSTTTTSLAEMFGVHVRGRSSANYLLFFRG